MYDDLLKNMESSHSALAGRLDPPKVVPSGSEGLVFRYAEQGIHQALVQKLARVISGLHAARLLMQRGFFQEQATLQRMLDELNDDTMFLAYGVISGEVTDLHREYLACFYQEEFDDPESAMKSAQKRSMVPRRKITAYLSRIVKEEPDPSSGIEAHRTVHKLYSGFVHAASPQIMEMYFGSPPTWHLRGMLGTTRDQDHRDDL